MPVPNKSILLKGLKPWVWCLMVALCLAGCSDKDTQGTPPAGLQESVSENSGAGPGEEGLEEDTGLSDRGDPCRTHRYILPPGKSEILTFEVQLPEGLELEIIPEELVVQNNHWEAVGLTAELGYCRIETVSAPSSLWMVDGRDYYSDALSRQKKLSTSTIGDVHIRWGKDGFGTLIEAGRHKNAAAVGKLTEETMADLLGDAISIDFTDPDTQQTYAWSVESQTVEKEVAILVIELGVDTPEESGGTGIKTLEVGEGADSWTLSAQYSDLQDVFVVNGPGERGDCFGESEF